MTDNDVSEGLPPAPSDDIPGGTSNKPQLAPKAKTPKPGRHGSKQGGVNKDLSVLRLRVDADATYDSIYQEFNEFGRILRIQLLLVEPETSMRYFDCHIAYESADSA